MTAVKQDIRIYHNPRCSKSRAALALLHRHGVEPQVIEYLSEPPDVQELKRVLRLLGLRARALLRSQEPVYETLGLSDPSLSEDALIAAMLREPVLIERPIVVAGDRALIGRPPENVLELLVS